MAKTTVYVAEMGNGAVHETWTVRAEGVAAARRRLVHLTGLTIITIASVAVQGVKRHWRAG